MFNNAYQQLVNTRRLSNNEEYYNNVFKKTERVVSAIEYVLSFIECNDRTKSRREILSQASATLHTVALESLNWFEEDSRRELHRLQHALVVLDSSVRVATAGRVVGPDATEVILHEIDSILRYIRNHFMTEDKRLSSLVASGMNEPGATRPSVPRRPRPIIPKNDLSSDAVLVYSQLSDRTTRIKTVLEAKPEATIKDITDIITDVSAKTIQRDLNAMIESGEVIRQGERRWSKYSIVK
jgi:hypothetical protein